MTTFTMFPVPDSNWNWIDSFLRSCAERGMICVVTLGELQVLVQAPGSRAHVCRSHVGAPLPPATHNVNGGIPRRRVLPQSRLMASKP
jgi:hypothetical protein